MFFNVTLVNLLTTVFYLSRKLILFSESYCSLIVSPFVTVLKFNVAGNVNAFAWLIARLWSWWRSSRRLRLKWQPTAREKVRYRNYVNTYVCEDDIMIDDNFSFKYFTRTQEFSVQFTVNVPPVLSIPVISSFLYLPRCTVRTFNPSQTTGLGALYGREYI